MNLTRRFVIGALGMAMCFSAMQLQAQTPTGVQVTRLDQVFETFVRTPEGDWKTIIIDANGVEKPFVYVPPNKVKPQIYVDLKLLRSDPGLRVLYEYEVANGADAAQKLALLLFRGVLPTQVNSVPPGWQLRTPPTPGSLTFRGPGLVPNSRARWSLESASLPGVIVVQAMGATADGSAIRVPDGLSPKQREELLALSANETVNVATVGPTIAAGIGEPEITFSIVLARVLMHYTDKLKQHNHPFARDVIRVSESLNRGHDATPTTPAVRAGLEQLDEIAKRRIENTWHRDLSNALANCVAALKTGGLPLRGTAEAAH